MALLTLMLLVAPRGRAVGWVDVAAPGPWVGRSDEGAETGALVWGVTVLAGPSTGSGVLVATAGSGALVVAG